MIKNQLVGIIILVFFTISCFSDDNNIELVTLLEGNLEIRSLKDLEDPAIQQYKIINGNLIINYADDLEDLSALQNLEKISGGIY